MRRTKILVADSLGIFRAGVRNVLRRESDLEVLEAATYEQVMDQVDRGDPDVVLIDLDLPPAGGVETVRVLSERCSARLVVWSFRPSRSTVLGAIRAGADGYLHKDISAAGLVRSLRGV